MRHGQTQTIQNVTLSILFSSLPFSSFIFLLLFVFSLPPKLTLFHQWERQPYHRFAVEFRIGYEESYNVFRRQVLRHVQSGEAVIRPRSLENGGLVRVSTLDCSLRYELTPPPTSGYTSNSLQVNTAWRQRSTC